MSPKIKKLACGHHVMVDDSHLSKWIEEDGRLDHEHVYLERFKHIVPEGGTVVDCGTSLGDHTVTYASWVGPKGKVLGFEANPDVAECCRLNLHLYPHAIVHNVALSNVRGPGFLQIEVNVGASHIVNEESSRTVSTTFALLDDYIDQVDRCDFVKIDVEGCEPRLLDGGRKFLSKYHPRILMEINPGCLKKQGFQPDDIFKVLKELGYVWLIADGIPESIHYDILCVHR